MPKIMCPFQDCGKIFPNKSTLRRHKQVHNKSKPFKCDECPKTFKFFPSKQKHKRLRHSKEPRPLFVCDVCQRTTVDFTGMRYHLMKMHEYSEDDARFEARGMICMPKNVEGMFFKIILLSLI